MAALFIWQVVAIGCKYGKNPLKNSLKSNYQLLHEITLILCMEVKLSQINIKLL